MFFFDKLSVIHRLEAGARFTRPQAEALSEAVHQAMSTSVATRSDLSDLRHEVRDLRAELKLWTGSLAAALFAGLGGLMAVLRFLGH